ncbi:MAG: cobyrinic acid a,c-diamide synthase, partial [Desulfovibrio sp.]|nr:cobyrinic acid a,c-diamide synthase [Desulfovibrio sp.]
MSQAGAQAGGAIFTVASVKGGVGKSVFAANFALALYRE